MTVAEIECTDGDIRLAGLQNPLSGRLEVCYGRLWGTVCNRGWDINDAVVACRQLGYSSTGNTMHIANI